MRIFNAFDARWSAQRRSLPSYFCLRLTLSPLIAHGVSPTAAMTLDVLQRPATSCGKATQRDGATISMKKTKKKNTLAIHIRARKAEDIPEQSDDDDDECLQRSLRASKQSALGGTGNRVSKKLEQQKRKGGGGLMDKTLQLTNMLRSEEAKLSQQLLVASEKGNKHAAYLLLHQGIDKDRCKGMVQCMLSYEGMPLTV